MGPSTLSNNFPDSNHTSKMEDQELQSLTVKTYEQEKNRKSDKEKISRFPNLHYDVVLISFGVYMWNSTL